MYFRPRGYASRTVYIWYIHSVTWSVIIILHRVPHILVLHTVCVCVLVGRWCTGMCGGVCSCILCAILTTHCLLQQPLTYCNYCWIPSHPPFPSHPPPLPLFPLPLSSLFPPSPIICFYSPPSLPPSLPPPPPPYLPRVYLSGSLHTGASLWSVQHGNRLNR